MITSFLTNRPRLSRHLGWIGQTFFKKISSKNFFLLFFKKLVFLQFDSAASFSDAKELKKHNEIANFAMFLSLKSRKFQGTIRMSKVPQACGFYLLVLRVILEPQRRIMLSPRFSFVRVSNF